MAFGATPHQAFLYYHFAVAMPTAHSSKKCFYLFNHFYPIVYITVLLSYFASFYHTQRPWMLLLL
jgi:hypothetical protein